MHPQPLKVGSRSLCQPDFISHLVHQNLSPTGEMKLLRLFYLCHYENVDNNHYLDK